MLKRTVCGSQAGSLSHWHMASGKCLHAITEDASHPLSRQKYTNQIFALEYSRDGTHFATAGKDAATVCAGDRIDLFADLGAQILRVRHSDRVYEVSLRRFGFDTGRLRPVVEVSVEIKFTARSS